MRCARRRRKGGGDAGLRDTAPTLYGMQRINYFVEKWMGSCTVWTNGNLLLWGMVCPSVAFNVINTVCRTITARRHDADCTDDAARQWPDDWPRSGNRTSFFVVCVCMSVAHCSIGANEECGCVGL